MAAEEDRCPNCGALVVEGAEWCGQCYTPLKAPTDPNPEPESVATPASETPAADSIPPMPAIPPATPGEAEAAGGAELVDTRAPLDGLAGEEAKATTWTCPSCDQENPLDLDICAVCGTPFARLFSEGPDARPVEPERAALMSVVPGLGHWICGQHGEAAIRFLFVVWGVAVGLLALLAKTSAQYPGGAKLHPVGVVYILSALIVYGIGFVDAHRAAGGHAQYLSVKILLYWFAALIFIFLISVFAAFLSVTKGRITPGGGGGAPTG